MKKLFIIAAAALVGMASCAKEGPTSDNNGGASGLLTIKLLNGPSNSTRATLAEESAVSGLEIWVFEDGGTELSSSEGDYVNYFGEEVTFSPSENGEYTAVLNVETGDKDVLVIANANLGETATAGMSMTEIMAEAAAQEFSKTNNKVVFTDGFVMAGWNLDVNIDGNAVCEVAIDRNVAKFAVPVEADEVTSTLTLDEWKELYPAEAEEITSIPTGFQFEMTGFAVLNGLPKSAAGFPWLEYDELAVESPYNYSPVHAYLSTTKFNYNNPWTGWDAGAYTYDGTPNTGAWKTQRSATNGATELELGDRLWSTADNMMTTTTVDANTMGQWAPYSGWMGATYGGAAMVPVYTYESKPGTLTNSANGYAGYNHDQVLAVIIGGTIVADGLPEVERYWRVNIRKSGNEAFHIIRNSVYTTSINSIATIGHPTPWDAENEEEIIDEPGVNPTDFVISINDWDEKEVGNDEL